MKSFKLTNKKNKGAKNTEEEYSSDNNSNTKAKWYKKPGWIAVLLIVFWPVGLYLMWEYTNLSKTTKFILTSIIVLFGVTSWVGVLVDTGEEKAQIAKNQTNTTQKQPETQLSEEEQIKKLVTDQFESDKNNMDMSYIREVDVVEQIDGGWGVFVEYNADDNITSGLRKSGIEKRMSSIYIALYTSEKDIRTATVTAYFPLVDQYGNESQDPVYKSALDKEEADKVNWDADSSYLRLTILPQVWRITFLHPEFQ